MYHRQWPAVRVAVAVYHRQWPAVRAAVAVYHLRRVAPHVAVEVFLLRAVAAVYRRVTMDAVVVVFHLPRDRIFRKSP